MYEDETLVCRDCGQEFVFSLPEVPRGSSRPERQRFFRSPSDV